MLHLAALALLLQTPDSAFTTPPSGDTTGYWQQGVHYRIVGRLDERRQVVDAAGELTYVNASPDTLRELYFHQYLNAFRPGSRWSAVDAREGRERFQSLRDPDFAYERFTRPPRVNGAPVRAEYPYAPDSTVVRLALPRPLAPGDSVRVDLAWEARPSTVPRRQARRGRHYDFAQWYPRIAVYDRGGWQHNPLVPAGEFYGEFGTYDVTLVLRDDQVVGATGVPVEGDPGWARVSRTGAPVMQRRAYADVPPGPSRVKVPAGHRAVRFLARDVHHFTWSTSPDFRYEGGVYVRDARERAAAHPVWDTVALHALYLPEQESLWGKGQVLARTRRALAWLESVFGPYAYPQLTSTDRIEGRGANESPMLVMYGSATPSIVLHEVAHMFAHATLANNEWRSGWMDEGLVSYLADWGLGKTPQDSTRPPAVPDAPLPPGADADSARAGLVAGQLAAEQEQFRLDAEGLAEPIGRRAQDFREYRIYSRMVYGRAKMMFGALRDVLGDSLFRAVLRDYYGRWALRHVDEAALRASAERVSGRDLDWFFDQWLRRTGLVDYALRDVEMRQEGDVWITRALVERVGAYRHPVALGARVGGEWAVVRADPHADAQWLEIRSAARPDEVRLDPRQTAPDRDRRNDVMPAAGA